MEIKLFALNVVRTMYTFVLVFVSSEFLVNLFIFHLPKLTESLAQCELFADQFDNWYSIGCHFVYLLIFVMNSCKLQFTVFTA